VRELLYKYILDLHNSHIRVDGGNSDGDQSLDKNICHRVCNSGKFIYFNPGLKRGGGNNDA